MTLTAQEQSRIISQESAWLDNAFGGVDLSQFPNLNSPPPEDKHGDRFARSYGDTALSRSARELRNFVQNPDTDAMLESGSGDLIRDLRDRRAEEVVAQFKRACSGYLPTDENYRSMIVTFGV